MIAFQSPDGIHWQRAREQAIIDGLSDEDGRMDSLNIAFYDTVREQYVVFYRAYRDGIRDIKTAASDSFVTTWPKSTWLEYPGAPIEELYTIAISPYSRAPHLFVGFPRRWMPERVAAQAVTPPSETGLSDAVFMSSRDGIHFHRWPEAIIRPGLRDEFWVARNTVPAWGVVETQSTIPGMPNELSIYVLERTYRGDVNKLRRYTYRLDGFVSVNAPYAGGEMVTRPLIFGDSDSAGNTQLLLNISTSAAGAAWVELQDGDGKPLDGYTLDDCDPIIGDAVEFVASWKGKRDLSALAGQPIRMRVVMQDADLYAFQFSAPSPDSKPRPR